MTRIDSNDASFYQDTSRLKNLRGREGLEAAAGQFEAMFLQMVLKNMRNATSAIADEDSFLNSQQQGFYQDMADGQLAAEMSRRGSMGIAEAMVSQLGGGLKNQPDAVAYPDTASPAFQQPLNRLAGGEKNSDE